MILYKLDVKKKSLPNLISKFLSIEIVVLFLIFLALVIALSTKNTFNFYIKNPPEVVFSHPSGFYSEPIRVSLGTSKKNATIRYTLDGSDPSLSSEESKGDVLLENTSVLRARLFKDDKPTGRIFTNTYFIKETSTLPVISLSTDPYNLMDDEYGIYRAINLLNRGREWERPVHIELFEPGGVLGFEMDAGIRIHGGATRRNSQKSFRICAREAYESTYFDYRFFPESGLDKYKCVILRNSGNDWKSTMIRDGVFQSLVSDLNVETQDYRPSVVFLNGDYMGIYNIREFYDDHYLKHKYGIRRDSVVIIEPDRTKKDGYPAVKNGNPGDEKHYVDLIKFVEWNSLSYQGHYEYVKTLMDVDNYIDYNIVEFYFGNDDWFTSNIVMWRFKSEFYQPESPDGLDGRWRWLVQDLDAGFGLDDRELYTLNVLDIATRPEIRIEGVLKPSMKYSGWPTLLFRSLLENEEFKVNFINRYADLLNSTFLSDRVIDRINEAQNLIRPEIQNHILRWGGKKDKGGVPAFRTIEEWESNVQVLRDYAINRPYYVRQQVIDKFNLSGLANIRVNIKDPTQGKVRVNTLSISDSTRDLTYFKDIPIQISAIPNPGYKFVKWEGVLVEKPRDISITLSEDFVEVTPMFERDTLWGLKKFLNIN